MTSFFVDMQAPGIEICPIRQANGEPEFNDVFIPDSQRVGAEGAGWEVPLHRETTILRDFAGLSLERIPDETTVLNFRRLPAASICAVPWFELAGWSFSCVVCFDGLST